MSTLWMGSLRSRGAARLLASPILQEYDAFTIDKPTSHEPASVQPVKAVAAVASRTPASVQPVEAPDARLLARPILQEYDAFHS